MLSSETINQGIFVQSLLRPENFAKLSNEELVQLFQASLKLFAQRFQTSEIDTPFSNAADVTATDVAITCTAMLEAVNIQVFELGLWQSWQGHS